LQLFAAGIRCQHSLSEFWHGDSADTNKEHMIHYLTLKNLPESVASNIIPDAIAACIESDSQEWCQALSSNTSKASATLSLDMWERIAEDCEREEQNKQAKQIQDAVDRELQQGATLMDGESEAYNR